MSSFLTTLGLMVVFYFIFEVTSRWSVRMDEQNKHGFFSNAVAFLAAINYALSFAVAGLVTWHDSRSEKIHRKIFLEDRKPYEDVLQSQIATLSAENKRLESVIEFYKDNHRKEIIRISEERRESGYFSGYISGFKSGFDYCLDRTEYSGNDESELRLDARAVANYEAKKWLQEQMTRENL